MRGARLRCRPIPDRAVQAAVALMHPAQRGIDRLPRRGQHVPHQKQQDPDLDRVQERMQTRRRAPHHPIGNPNTIVEPAMKPNNSAFPSPTPRLFKDQVGLALVEVRMSTEVGPIGAI
jgi:hypothetical protein